jgi:hypothetical protein
MSRYVSPGDDNGLGPLPALVLLCIGMVIGMVVITLARWFDRPAPVMSVNGIECRICHAPVLNTYSKYRAYHQKKRTPVVHVASGLPAGVLPPSPCRAF